jgi:multidrug efflux pump subunit AcrA (membrane-fusion protein)
MASGAACAAEAREDVIKGKLEYSTHSLVRSPFAGKVKELHVDYGQSIEPGTVLGVVELDYGTWTSIKSKLLHAHDAITRKPGRESMRLNLDTLIQKRKAKQQLIEKGFSAEESLVDIDTEIKALQLKIRDFDKAMELERQDYNDEISKWEKIFYKDITPNQFPQVAPFIAEDAGYVVSINSDIQVGSTIGAGAVIATVSAMDPILVKAQVFESDVVNLKIGKKAKVRVISLGDREFPAVLKSISWTPVQESFDRPSYYNVVLEVENADLKMKEGFEVQVAFDM